MFYIVSKLFWLLFQPLHFIFFLLVLSVIALRFFPLFSRLCLFSAVFFFFVIGVFPLGHNMLVYLERQYSTADAYTGDILPTRVDGILVLGGVFDAPTSQKLGKPVIGDSVERITEGVALSYEYPDALFVFSGGNGSLRGGVPETVTAKEFLAALHYNTDAMVFEGKSRNTYENAAFSKAILKPKDGQTWILVTSAYHMNRARRVFATQGWNVISYPVDYKTDLEYRIIPQRFDIAGNMYKFHLASKEMVGTIAYQFTGKIASEH